MLQESTNTEESGERGGAQSDAVSAGEPSQEHKRESTGSTEHSNPLAVACADQQPLSQLALQQLLSDDSEQHLGVIRAISGVQTTLPMGRVAQHTIRYPKVVVDALADIFNEYNTHFQPLVQANREFTTDYACTRDASDRFVNSFVQIDMLGLSPQFLTAASQLDRNVVREVLRGSIFEIENSLAMYQLLERVFSNDAGQTVFKMGFRRALDDLRQQHGRPIALLAVTDEKLTAMRESEFGKRDGEHLLAAEVRELSGFDALLGPDDFKHHVAQNNGHCKYLLYVRASDPPVKLKDPKAHVGNPLLDDAELRRIIKANSLTFNIDGSAQVGEARINDTKAYLQSMGMGFNISNLGDLVTPSGKLAQGFSDYLLGRGIDPLDVEQRRVSLRAKPLRGTYGCYGHIRGVLNSGFKRELRLETAARGDYVVQPEMKTPTMLNTSDGNQYTYIDRNFFSCTGGEIRFLGGMRTHMLVDSREASSGRIHGSNQSVYQQVY